MAEEISPLGTNQAVLRYAAYDADDDLRVRREFHENYSRMKGNFHEWVIRQMPIRPMDHLLDVGTGPGDFPQLLRRLGHEGVVVGMDLSEGMARTAKASDPTHSWLVADAQHLPFADGTFNGTMARHMLYHVPDIDRAVQEMARVTTVGGWTAAVTNGRDNMTMVYQLWDAIDHPAVVPVASISARFPIETAADYFTPYFADVQTIVQDDAVILPTVEPLVYYLFSGRHLLMKPEHTETEWQEVQTLLVEAAEALWTSEVADGVLTISKRVGLVVGHRQ
jgi:ubiquinone/menaquinone biosynthesis C-methylase UbiE